MAEGVIYLLVIIHQQDRQQIGQEEQPTTIQAIRITGYSLQDFGGELSESTEMEVLE